MNTTPMIASTGDQFAGVFGLIIGLLGLVLAITWLIFPFLVLSRFDKLLKINREIVDGQREIAMALQWMVNNWKQEGSKPPDQPPV
jgi:hypothetical protein